MKKLDLPADDGATGRGALRGLPLGQARSPQGLPQLGSWPTTVGMTGWGRSWR